MCAAAAPVDEKNPHVPVLIEAILAAVAPVTGHWLDGTFGAGGYARALLDAGAESVIAVDRDPLAFGMAADWAGAYGDRLVLQRGVFSDMADFAEALDGVVLDLGVSSMQLDRAERGFSFLRDGPLDMRMGGDGPTAADLVNAAEERVLADILFRFGEERASRRIARAIVRARAEAPITRTARLAEIVEGCLPRSKPGQSHPATRSFQAIRIAVNAEFDELWRGLMAAEAVLRPGGWLAVVTFHSIEDRMVKQFLTARAAAGGQGSRHAPVQTQDTPRFELRPRKAIAPDPAEVARNPRARSARLRVARRTDAPAGQIPADAISTPRIAGFST